MFSAMLASGAHAQLHRLVQERDFVVKIMRSLESPSSVIRAKAFLVLLQVLCSNRDMLLLCCNSRYGQVYYTFTVTHMHMLAHT
uniref:Uncharacterized protein n=1 Tax=Hucho hucho TaxID=62062 RepID=A0A4W5L009_9TELE